MPVSIPETFLTESRTNDVLEPEAMTRVRKEHSRLQEVVRIKWQAGEENLVPVAFSSIPLQI